MTRPVVFRPEAEEDLRSAWIWYEQQWSGLGDDFAGQVSAVLDQVAQMPELFPTIWLDVRCCRPRRFPYAVYYRALADYVEVLAVMHVRRDPTSWQSRA